jgi:CheY-like chemotaxis protein
MAAAARKTPPLKSHTSTPIQPEESQCVPVCPASEEHSHRGVVLVVDDEDTIRQVVVRILESEGFCCLEACDGIDALEAFARSPDTIDFLLSDVSMPRMDGLELASRVAVIRPAIKVLIMSGHLLNCSLPHGWRFLAKPFRTRELLDRMGELDQSSQAAAIEQRRAG